MAKKKTVAKKTAKEKTFMIKVAEKIGEIAGEISVGKDHLMEMAAGAVSSVKAGIHHITDGKKNIAAKLTKPPVKKAAQKKAKAAATVTPKSRVIKKAGIKKPIKKAIKKGAAKVLPPAVKKTTKTAVVKKGAAKKTAGRTAKK